MEQMHGRRQLSFTDTVRRYGWHPNRNYAGAFLGNDPPHTLAHIFGDTDYVRCETHAEARHQAWKIAGRVLVPSIEIVFKRAVPGVNCLASQQARRY